MNRLTLSLGKRLATYLAKDVRVGSTAPPSDPLHLQAALRPGDVLLVEGRSRISSAIKYLTQSTWSHAALYIGSDYLGDHAPADHCLIEADTLRGVCSSSLERYAPLHTRICRPIGLSAAECAPGRRASAAATCACADRASPAQHRPKRSRTLGCSRAGLRAGRL